MSSSVKTESDMELDVLPSQFLNFIMNKTLTNYEKKGKTTVFPLSKSMKRALDSETVIVSVYKHSK